MKSNKIINKYLKLVIKIIDFILSKKEIMFLSFLRRLILTNISKMIYIVEEGNWSINWDGKYIVDNLTRNNLYNANLLTPILPRNRILHFGSINCLINSERIISIHNSNKVVLTWFHIIQNDERVKSLPFLSQKISLLHTSNEFTKNKLIFSGFEANKIVKIPLGVDLLKFKQVNDNKRNTLKKKFKLPKDKIIIGSFQKDGEGWGEGLKPKLIKGPDIFCKVIKKLSEKYSIHVFLTGPARGFVKKQLEESQISYTHIFLKNYVDIVDCYNVLDLYLITSRAEGGPKALLEAMATGVPIVSTNVGMVPEVVKTGINGFTAGVDDVDQIYSYAIEIIENQKLRQQFINNGLEIIKNYSWEEIAKQYYNKIYRRL